MAALTALNLRQLHHAVLLADEAHFGRAAERAFLSQSAFSRSIAALEDQVAMRLFDRGPGFVRLTVPGERVVARARRLLASSNDLSRELNLLRSGDLGDIVVGAGPYSGANLMAPAVAELHLRHPAVKVKVEIAQSLVLQHQLVAEQIDFFMADLSELPAHPQCRVEWLGSMPGSLYARAEHPLARERTVSLAALRGQRFASVHLPGPLARRLGALLGADDAGLLPLALECESALVLREYLLRHDVLVSAPRGFFALEAAAGHLRELHVPELQGQGAQALLRMDLGIVWPADRTPSPAVDLLTQLLRTHAAAALQIS
jgi:DNA-binding transcriptional LysR family regulator